MTIPVKGVGGDWIIKLPAQNYMHVPEHEFAMMQLASMIGMEAILAHSFVDFNLHIPANAILLLQFLRLIDHDIKITF